MMGAATEITLDLHAAIDKLLLFKSDLQAYYWDRAATDELPERERHQIALWTRQVSERTVTLEDVVMRLGYPIVVVTLSGAAAETLRGALRLIERSIDEGEPFDRVLRSVAVVLNAADVVCLRAASGRRHAAARRGVAQVERIAGVGGSRTGSVVARIVPSPRPMRAEAEKTDGAPTRNVGS